MRAWPFDGPEGILRDRGTPQSVMRSESGSAYLRALHGSFLEARVAAGERTATLEIDGTAIELRFAGAAMADAVLPGLARRICRRPERAASFTVELWDSASAGISPPSPPWGIDDAGVYGAVRGYNDAVSKLVVDHRMGTVTACALSEGLAVVWAASAARLSGWWRAMPLRQLLGWLLARPGRHLVHAAATGRDGRGLLIAGRGRAGKSTLSAACAAAGMDFMGDDYVLLGSGAEPRVHAVYGTARLDPRSLARVPTLAPLASFTDEEKAVLDLAATRSAKAPDSLKVEAIVMPRFSDSARSRLRRMSGAATFRALAVSTTFQAPNDGGSALSLIGEVARTVPSYELEIGRNLSRAPELLLELLAATGTPA